ncbi:MAG: sulfatase-like hydrolase/transferase [Marivita sp.]|uniref:sulfatase family protein n=1 Tax=Marivita sp. TaxID=2003365 RepID=UPI0025C305EE|nr:sulfatase-like hydrolase/transferase [Marivita sp.]MCI5112293.1 sulfatase-like hydrolase/transferase [Marivita sp.]
MSRKPNFILFITDQLRADFLGCYGHPVVRSPNIDALASRGLAFDRFYVSSPVCMPNRASLMTGRWPSVSGVRANGIPLSQDRVTFVELLRAAGYRTALCGKSHLQNFTGRPPVFPETGSDTGTPPPRELSAAIRGTLDDPAHGQEDPAHWQEPDARVQTPFYGFDHVDLVTSHGDDLGGDYRRWLLERDPDALTRIGAANQLPHDYSCPQAVRTAIPEELYSTSYIAECADACIEENAGDDPFFLMVSFPDPHHPFNPPGRYWDMYDPDDMAIPAAFTRNDWVPPPHVQGRLDARDTGKANLAGMDTIGCSAREAQEAQALTCGMITMIDDAIGRICQTLKASGCDEDTVILFTSDHGENLGDHRLLLKGAECYEQVTRVPFIWSDPKLEEAKTGKRTERIAQTHDIGAAILARAGLAPFEGFQGADFIDGPGRDAALIQYEHQRLHPGLGVPPRVHSLRTDRYRISVIEGVDWGELYDLETDPGEFDNLWDEPDAADIRHALTEQLLRAEIGAIDRVPVPIRQA